MTVSAAGPKFVDRELVDREFRPGELPVAEPPPSVIEEPVGRCVVRGRRGHAPRCHAPPAGRDVPERRQHVDATIGADGYVLRIGQHGPTIRRAARRAVRKYDLV